MPLPENVEKQPVSPAVWLLCIAVLDLTVSFIPIPNRLLAGAMTVGVTLAYVGLVVAFALSVARSKWSIPTALTGMGYSIALWLAVYKFMQPLLDERASLIRQSGGRLSKMGLLALSYTATVQDLALIGAAVCGGAVLARLIKHPNMVGPIGAMIALIDTWGVLFGGPVSQMLNNPATKKLAGLAMAGGPHSDTIGNVPRELSINVPNVGIGDFLFIGLLLCVLVNLDMNWRTSARFMAVAVSLALLSIVFLPFVPALPGLVFIGAGAVFPNLKYFRFTREEKFALLYAGILVLVLTGGAYFGVQSKLASHKQSNPAVGAAAP